MPIIRSRPFPTWILVLILLACTSFVRGEVVELVDLDISKIAQSLERPRTTGAKSAVTIGKRPFDRSINTRAESRLHVALDGRATTFSTFVGISDAAHDSFHAFRGIVREVTFSVYGDGRLLQRTGPLKKGTLAEIQVPLAGIHELVLAVDGPAGAFATWAGAKIEYTGARPYTTLPPEERKVVRIASQPKEPRINGAAIVGIRPGTPLIFTVAATGERPMHFSATQLPDGLTLDPASGILTGRITRPGDYAISVSVKNTHGEAHRELHVVVGDALALTPPMSWNAWNVIEGLVSATVMKEMADAFVDNGYRDVGYQYINIDDGWVIARDETGKPVVDPVRFPNGLREVSDYLHARGLKLGIYSSPGVTTCASYPGSYGHEEIDAETWAEWGVDFVKYDTCSCPRERKRELYGKMGRLLKQSPRSIIYSLSGGDPVWGAEVSGHMWRTTSDIREQWSLPGNTGIIEIFDKQPAFAALQHPGAWNDPDFLVIGIDGKGASANDVGAKGATETEYRSQMSLWCLLSAPLTMTADLRTIRPASLQILTNPEVIDIDQDPLGLPPVLALKAGDTEIWLKSLADGSQALALFNRGEHGAALTVNWNALGVKANRRLRDLWKREDLGVFPKGYTAEVPGHGVVLLKLSDAAADLR
ncbi:MAG TPA: NPCBM/NEW2 domain-containing protein [Rariglobus sp.]